MAPKDGTLPPIWDDLDWQMGQLFMMGFDGTTVDDQIRSLIENYHVGSIMLSAKNLKSAEETTKLILELQTIARDAGHPVPLLIALDQENGGVNSLYDEIYIRQFPSAMGIAATGSKRLAHEVASATAQELRAVGVNWILGPVLDVLTNVRSQPIGVRTSGDDPQEVSQYGVETMKGYQEAGLVTCGKHFPSYGNIEFVGSQTDVPVITESLEQLSLSALVPFRNAIANGLDAMMVGGVAMSSAGVNVMHACLSEQVVDGLLRKEMKFDGVVVSECLEMEALTHNIGVGGGTVMAMKAGCDVALLCRSYPFQLEALNGLKLGVENGMISRSRITQSLQRVLSMKARCTTWEQALNPGGIEVLTHMQPSHTSLSTRAYDSSITLVRDTNNLLPLPQILEPDEELLLLTPLVKPLPASAVSRSMLDLMTASPDPSASWEKGSSISSGESVFREFGRSLARQRSGRVLHTSYTSTGVRPIHESLIDRASAVVILTADSNRNLYQHGFTKHVSMICKSQYSQTGERREKPVIVVAVSSPYDFAIDPSIGTYICTYDFTETALQALVKVLYGELSPTGSLPGTVSRSQKIHQSRQHWLVEAWNEQRDSEALDALLDAVRESGSHAELTNVSSHSFLLRNDDVDEAHFVVRNSTTQALYGFCTTYFFRSTGTGVIGSIFVDPARRKLSIGHSLHNRAIRSLLQRKGVKRFQLGSRLPSIYLGIPAANPVERKRLRQWFAQLGWNTALSRPLCSVLLRPLSTWTAPEGLAKSLHTNEVDYDLVHGWEYAESIFDHIKTNSRQGVMEIYKMALNGAPHSGVIRAKRPEDGAILGSVVIYNSQSAIAEYIPALHKKDKEREKQVNGSNTSTVNGSNNTGGGGGVSSPVISPSVGEYATLMQGLILLGIKQVRKSGADAVMLDCVDGDGNFDSLTAMGFTVLHSFEEVTCDATTWKLMQPS
ncbi:beta-N-acetylglucosaminidase, putative [Talaromyces stipitatus ATCC 10500]|uniref:Beta-N-acetylglucosaminidase, putative n=1 Tax=Talaromyces stipitatus (strain ATCC 10500 / CBS 375.48 / QM 6759 / NRRL 1006) TaxID=441959 RepID=B8MC28_TALSN|nr:beta-N-acetylglucosaminidase, putative [Talaromyces stipitatus ATCC 10500]EED18474.1 beta-N-acetylglucosaminidase, putative [Talaromyces stipitatus ATCC 10500]